MVESFVLSPGGGGGGGHFHWGPYQMLEEKKRGKRVSNSGVGAECTDREKGVKIEGKKGGKGYPNH